MTIHEYVNIKRHLITTALAMVSFLTVSAQSVTYNHDESVMNQVTVQETGSGSLTPDLYYDVLHKSYRNSASACQALPWPVGHKERLLGHCVVWSTVVSMVLALMDPLEVP